MVYKQTCNEVTAYRDRKGKLHSTTSGCKTANARYVFDNLFPYTRSVGFPSYGYDADQILKTINNNYDLVIEALSELE